MWPVMARPHGEKVAKFVKQYADTRAASAHGEEVRSGQFPGAGHTCQGVWAILTPGWTEVINSQKWPTLEKEEIDS